MSSSVSDLIPAWKAVCHHHITPSGWSFKHTGIYKDGSASSSSRCANTWKCFSLCCDVIWRFAQRLENLQISMLYRVSFICIKLNDKHESPRVSAGFLATSQCWQASRKSASPRKRGVPCELVNFGGAGWQVSVIYLDRVRPDVALFLVFMQS